MQNDLISRSALIEELRTTGELTYLIKGAIDNQPTAYSVEKVVAELEELKLKRSDDSVYGIGVLNGYSEAIDYIVRNGGKE